MRSVWIRLLAVMTTLAFCCPAELRGMDKLDLIFCCEADNDLYQLVCESGDLWVRFETPEEAVRCAPRGAGVLIFADGYPEETVTLEPVMLDEAAAKKLRVYIEYPKALAGIRIRAPREVQLERAVVATNMFAPKLERLSILSPHVCSFVPVDAVGSSIVLSRVAGFDKAVYGLPDHVCPFLPEAKMFPLLVKHPLGDVLIATAPLSHFISGRFAPAEAWETVWEGILRWVTGEDNELWDWTPPVRATFAPEDPLPAIAQYQALRRGAQWYFNARMLIHSSWQDKVVEAASLKDRVGPAPQQDWIAGDGKLGILEGFASKVDVDGYQPARYWLRNDCTSEAAMALAFDGKVNDQAKSLDAAANLNDFIHFLSPLTKGPRSEPASPSFGLIGWNTSNEGVGVYYGDDNARSMLGTMATAALLESDRWDKQLLRCLLANFRTTGTNGFRDSRIDEGDLRGAGWRHYFNAPTVNCAPHYEAYLWACFLWGYGQTQHAPLLERTKAAIKMTMEAYPDKWRWTNGIQQERARMLLPLAWLVRIEDTPEHRQWLRRIAQDLLVLQAECGAIQEALGPEGMGAYGPPKSNEEYGTNEATLIQQNGDTVCDLLYTANFAFLGLHEAAAATGEDLYETAEYKLADFLCRIQVRSETHQELDGAWFRAFDFKRWECWGSNADVGWGAWAVETGWSQGWITSVFGLRQMKTSLWELTASSQVEEHFAEIHTQMFPPQEAAPDESD